VQENAPLQQQYNNAQATTTKPAAQGAQGGQGGCGTAGVNMLVGGATICNQGQATQTKREKDCADTLDMTKTICADTLGLSAIANNVASATAINAPGISIQQQCENAAKTAELASMLNTAKAGVCEAEIISCMSSCPTMPDPPPQPTNPPDQNAPTPKTDSNHKKCSSYQIAVAAMMAQAAQGVAAVEMAAQCKKIVTAMAAPPLPMLPGSTGLAPYTPVDCSNGANSSSPLCQSCVSNPNGPGCSSATVPGAGFAGNPSTPGAGYQNPINENPAIAPNVKPVTGPQSPVSTIPNNQGGGGLAGGGSGNGQRAATSDNPGAGNNSGGYNTGVMGGPMQGGGFGGFGAGKGTPVGGGGAWDKLKQKLGLAGLVPKAKAANGPRREISSADGPTIWEKVSYQYQKDSELKP
jgi:hypothetical protein